MIVLQDRKSNVLITDVAVPAPSPWAPFQSPFSEAHFCRLLPVVELGASETCEAIWPLEIRPALPASPGWAEPERLTKPGGGLQEGRGPSRGGQPPGPQPPGLDPGSDSCPTWAVSLALSGHHPADAGCWTPCLREAWGARSVPTRQAQDGSQGSHIPPSTLRPRKAESSTTSAGAPPMPAQLAHPEVEGAGGGKAGRPRIQPAFESPHVILELSLPLCVSRPALPSQPTFSREY